MGSALSPSVLSGASLVLPDRVLSGQAVVIDGDRIVDITREPRGPGARIDLTGRFVVPGFIDVHVHGLAGADVLDGGGAVRAVAARLPRWGVTAFCPTSMACPPADLDRFLGEVAQLRAEGPRTTARVLPAHLESNFINPEFRGAQPLGCLRVPADTAARSGFGDFSAADVLAVIDRHRPDVGIVTLAPEIPGGVELVRAMVAGRVRVSIGHSNATFEEAQAAIAAGAAQATHLFNRMRPMKHRDPGIAGAVLANEDMAAELICDGHHVHPAMMRLAVAAKTASRVMAITDGTSGSGLPSGSRARLGGQPITVREVARLDDGTIAGSVLTMDRAFATLVTRCGLDLVQAAAMCSTTPARELRLIGLGVLAPGAIADFAVLDSQLEVVETWIGGARVWARGTPEGPRPS